MNKFGVRNTSYDTKIVHPEEKEDKETLNFRKEEEDLFDLGKINMTIARFVIIILKHTLIYQFTYLVIHHPYKSAFLHRI
jgi:hypothetical protein